jgi:hypothetical protein
VWQCEREWVQGVAGSGSMSAGWEHERGGVGWGGVHGVGGLAGGECRGEQGWGANGVRDVSGSGCECECGWRWVRCDWARHGWGQGCTSGVRCTWVQHMAEVTGV